MSSTDLRDDEQNDVPSDERRDPAALERDSEEIRADMDRTLDALERKFSPGQVLDRSMSAIREHGPELANQLLDSVKRNPLPILLTAAGLVWLAVSETRPSSAAENHKGARNPLRSRVRSDFANASQSQGLKSRIRARVHAAGDRLHTTTDRLRFSKDAVLNRVTGALENPREQTQLAQQKVSRLLDEQPLVLGAVGLAVGAIVGAAIPTTQYENRVLGRAREQALAKARELGERQYETLRGAIHSGTGDGTSQQPLS
jgi:hypothetical protein